MSTSCPATIWPVHPPAPLGRATIRSNRVCEPRAASWRARPRNRTAARSWCLLGRRIWPSHTYPICGSGWIIHLEIGARVPALLHVFADRCEAVRDAFNGEIEVRNVGEGIGDLSHQGSVAVACDQMC